MEPILITGEKPIEESNPSEHPAFRAKYPRLFAPLQTEAYRRVREGRSCALVAPTSSGKTLAVAAPLFETKQPAVFVLPFRALIIDQSQELVRIASMFGISEDRFARVWGGITQAEVNDAVKRDYMLITPDKLVSLFISGRSGNAAALNLLDKYAFVFDEVHIYNAMMQASLLYFLRSVRHWQELGNRKSGFYFLSATFPKDIWELLQRELGLTDEDRIEGKSFTGNVRLVIKPAKTVTRTTNGQVPIAQDIAALDIETNTVGIFNTAYRAWQVSQAVIRGLLFIGQDKQNETERRRNFGWFDDSPDEYALIGSSAIEAGVDFKARNLVIEESDQDSFVQRFGRAARSGQDAFVLAYSDTLYKMSQPGELAARYSRADFLGLLRERIPLREPRKLYAGLSAYAYYKFWHDPSFPMEPEHLKLCRQLEKKGVDNLLAFRGMTPYTHYESGESIGFKSLFRKALKIDPKTGKVEGAPNPLYYFTRPKRMPVAARVVEVADKEELEDNSVILLARVKFDLGLGTHWVLLELKRASDQDSEDDNIALEMDGKQFRPSDGRTGDLLVNFYNLDV